MYLSDFKTLENIEPTTRSSWINKLRRDGLRSFKRLGFPTDRRGNERWKYTNVSPITRIKFAYPFSTNAESLTKSDVKTMTPWSDNWATLVFIDGKISTELSTKIDSSYGFSLVNLENMPVPNSEVVQNHLGKLASTDDDAFTAVNTAFITDGALINVPDDNTNTPVIHLIWIDTSRPKPTVTHPRTLIVMGRNSNLKLIESYAGLGANFTNAVAEILVGDESEIEHYRYLNESNETFHIGTTRVHVGRNSRFNSTSISKGSRLARNDLNVLLKEEGGSCSINGLYITSGSQHIDNHINVDHSKPNTTSNQYFKGILDGQSRAVFSGRVLVRKAAQKTYAKQADKNLLLSEGARVNTKPSLEIYADDVQCFHGATAGAVAEDALFYMRSRGLTQDIATALLVNGFASEIIELIGLDEIKNYIYGFLPSFVSNQTKDNT